MTDENQMETVENHNDRSTGALLLTGCGLLSKENVKLRDLDFTVLSEEKIPEELKTVIAEKERSHFS